MVLPKYIETQWFGEGKSVLRFYPKPEQTRDEAVTTSYGQITCYMSSLRIWEYTEIAQMRNDNEEVANVNDSSLECQGDTKPLDATAFICPPEVSVDIWQSWLVHWEAWREIYIPLAWIQNYRNLCKPSHVAWHDSYISENPWVLPLITEGIDGNRCDTPSSQDYPEERTNKAATVVEKEDCDHSSKDIDSEKHAKAEAQEKVHAEEVSDGRKAELDKLYDEFSGARYWVHLMRFLLINGVQPSEILNRFFNKHGHVDFCESPSKCDNDIPDFMRDRGNTISVKKKSALQNEENTELNTMKENDCLNVDEVCSTISSSMSNNDEPVKSEKLCSGYLNQSNSEQVDKIGTKRRQEDLCEDGHSEGSEAEKSSTMHIKRPRHNPLLEKNTSVVSECKVQRKSTKEKEASSSDDEEECVDSEDKENADVLKASENSQDKKLAKHKKKKKNSMRHHHGVAWVMQYIEKANLTGDIVTNKRDRENDEPTSVPPSEGNIFSVAENYSSSQKAHCLSVSQDPKDITTGQVEGLCSLVNFPSGDYQFRADRLNLKEDSSKLSRCFNLQENSSFYDKESDVTKSVTGGKNDIVDENTSTEGCLSNNNEEKGENDNMVSEEDDVDKEDKTVDIIKNVALGPSARNGFWFFPNAFPALKNFLIMCASHLLSLIVPSVSVGFSGILGRLPFLRNLFGLSDSKKSATVKRKKKGCQAKLESWLQQESPSTLCPHGFHSFSEFYSYAEKRGTHTLYQSLGLAVEGNGTSYVEINTLDLKYFESEGTDRNMERAWQRTHIVFDDDGNPTNVPEREHYLEAEDMERDWHRTQIVFDDDGNPISVPESEHCLEAEDELNDQEREKLQWRNIIANHRIMSYKIDAETLPPEFPQHLHKYWAQRHRIFLRYDEGIQLDEESWYSVTPEMIAAHHAYRCKCNVAIDAFCGAGGNAIQLASTCNRVIAIDIDPAKIKLARHNAVVYGVEDRIEFIVGDYFEIVPQLSADVVLLTPPWGGTEYTQKKIYNVKNLDGVLNCEDIMKVAKSVTKNIAIYLPRSSDLCQVIELAGVDNSVDLEYNYMGHKIKALSAYYGDLIYY